MLDVTRRVLKLKAIALRKQGKAITEIAKELGICKATAFKYTKDYPATPEMKYNWAQKRCKPKFISAASLLTEAVKKAKPHSVIIFDEAAYNLFPKEYMPETKTGFYNKVVPMNPEKKDVKKNL